MCSQIGHPLGQASSALFLESTEATEGLGRPAAAFPPATPSGTEEPITLSITPTVFWLFEATEGRTTKSETSRRCGHSPHRILPTAEKPL